MTFSSVTHVIFDLDGLLLDTETLYTEAYNRIAQQYGKTYTWELKAKIMGFKTEESVATIINTLNLPITSEDFINQLDKLYDELFPGSNILPGVEKLLNHLKNNKIPFALATSSTKSGYEIKSQNWQHLFKLFNHLVFGGTDDEVKNGKPSPDIFLIAAKRFADNPNPSKCLVFEDSPNGVEAALAAGMQVVMVPDENLPKDLTKRATLVLSSLEEFKPETFGLPPYK